MSIRQRSDQLSTARKRVRWPPSSAQQRASSRAAKRGGRGEEGRQMQAIPGHWRSLQDTQQGPRPGEIAFEQGRRTHLRRGSIPPSSTTPTMPIYQGFCGGRNPTSPPEVARQFADQGNRGGDGRGNPGVPFPPASRYRPHSARSARIEHRRGRRKGGSRRGRDKLRAPVPKCNGADVAFGHDPHRVPWCSANVGSPL